MPLSQRRGSLIISLLNIEATPSGGDLHFHHAIDGKMVQVAVTHACLASVFGSNGSTQGNEEAFRYNVIEILHVAVKKGRSSTERPVVLTAEDFK
jgi:hypothetical protein